MTFAFKLKLLISSWFLIMMGILVANAVSIPVIAAVCMLCVVMFLFSIRLGVLLHESINNNVSDKTTEPVVPVVDTVVLLEDDTSALKALKIFQAAGITITEAVLQSLPRAATAIEAYEKFYETDQYDMSEQLEILQAQVELLKKANESFAVTNSPPKLH